jgi:hypothetical protein
MRLCYEPRISLENDTLPSEGKVYGSFGAGGMFNDNFPVFTAHKGDWYKAQY